MRLGKVLYKSIVYLIACFCEPMVGQDRSEALTEPLPGRLKAEG